MKFAACGSVDVWANGVRCAIDCTGNDHFGAKFYTVGAKFYTVGAKFLAPVSGIEQATKQSLKQPLSIQERLTDMTTTSSLDSRKVADEAQKQPMKVKAAQRAVAVNTVRETGGFVERRTQANLQGSINGLDIDHFVRMIETRSHSDWWWIGEQPGKWLEAAALTSMHFSDNQLEAKARSVLARMLAAQSDDGYLGITDPKVISPAAPLRGMDAYELYFTLHGLLSASEMLSDPAALAAAVRLADYLVDKIGPGKAEFWPSPLRPPHNRNTIICPQYVWVPEGTPISSETFTHSDIAGHTAHYGLEGTLLIDPMLRLYQAVGDERYLHWATWVVSRMDEWSGWDTFSKLDLVADGTIGLHQLQPYVHVHTLQMNMLGLLRLYEITGSHTLLRKVTGAWQETVNRQMYITGGVSVGEHYEPGLRKPLSGHVVETCANMSWLQLNQALLEMTGDPKYADVIERLLWNHVFAAQTVDGDCYRYHTPPNGSKPAQFFHGPDCCTSSGMRLAAMLPSVIYAHGQDGLYVNQFVPSTAHVVVEGGTTVAITQQTDYPADSTVRLLLDSNAPANFNLHLRMPAWCSHPCVSVNGEEVRNPRPGTYLSISRRWQQGDNVLLTFPMDIEWIESDGGENDDPESDDRRWALVRGPVVFAIDSLWLEDHSGLCPGDDFVVNPHSAILPSAELPEGALGPAFHVPVKLADNAALSAVALPFANVGIWYRPGSPVPDKDTAVYSYAVWLKGSADGL